MDELTRQITDLLGTDSPKAVFRKRSCIITSGEGKVPHLERCHVFVPTDEKGTERMSSSIVVRTSADARRVCDILKNRYGMKKYPKGKADPSWLVEAWL